MPTYTLPSNLGDILGAHHDGNLNTQVCGIKAAQGVLKRGTVLAAGTLTDAGKLVPLTAGTEAEAFGILLDPVIDTGAAYSDGTVTGSVARSGTFLGAALLVPVGVDAVAITNRLRELGIFIEGVLVAATAAAMLAEEREIAVGPALRQQLNSQNGRVC